MTTRLLKFFIFLTLGLFIHGIEALAQVNLLEPNRPKIDSLYILSLPVSAKDPLTVIMPEGPLLATQRDIDELNQELAEKKNANRDCIALQIAGMQAVQTKSFDQAASFMQKAVDGNCQEGFAGIYLGAVAEETKRYNEAVKPLLLAREQLPKSRPNHRYIDFADAILGRILFRQKRYKEAAFYLNELLKKYPNDLPHNYFMGMSLVNLNVPSQGEPYLRRVIQVSAQVPRSTTIAAESYFALGVIRFAAADFGEARFMLRECLRRDSRHPGALQLLPQVEERLRKRKGNNQLDQYLR